MNSNMVCEKCQPSAKSTEALVKVENDGCKEIYSLLDSCMKNNKGNISSCREEWNKFRSCYNKK